MSQRSVKIEEDSLILQGGTCEIVFQKPAEREWFGELVARGLVSRLGSSTGFEITGFEITGFEITGFENVLRESAFRELVR